MDAWTSPSTTNIMNASRAPPTHCWATACTPASRNLSIADRASASLITSTACSRTGELGAQEVVGLSTIGKSNPASSSGT